MPNGQLVASLSRRNAWNGLKAWAMAAVLDRARLRRRLIANSLIDDRRLLADLQALRSFVRSNAQPQYHLCGTCRMRSADDGEAVVDCVGRVHGIDALRVVDASLFPTIPRGYTHIIVLMAAEKIADAIKADWRRLL